MIESKLITDLCLIRTLYTSHTFSCIIFIQLSLKCIMYNLNGVLIPMINIEEKENDARMKKCMTT